MEGYNSEYETYKEVKTYNVEECENINSLNFILPSNCKVIANLKDEDGNNLEELACVNPTKYAFPYLIMELFLRFMTFKHIKEFIDANEDTKQSHINIISQDSLKSQMKYAKMLYHSGAINIYQYKVYMLWYTFFEQIIDYENLESCSGTISGVDITIAKLVSIDGNISSGKSTVISVIEQSLESYPSLVLVPEPVDLWAEIKDDNGKDILSAYYDNPTEMAFTFQIMALFTRFMSLIQAFKEAKEKHRLLNKTITVLIERTILTDYHIFAEMLNSTKDLNDIEMKVYRYWFNAFSIEFPLSKCVYLRTDPDICHKRVGIRSRDGESKISKEYLVACHKQHEKFYSDILSKKECKVFDNNENMNTDVYEVNISLIVSHLLI